MLRLFNLITMFRPRFDWIQVEPTTYCNASCLYCPHTVYGDAWVNRHMSMGTFERLQPILKRTGLVFLQGWGEPLLSPHFFQMAAVAKASGCAVGASTNGTLLDIDVAKQLIKQGFDIIAFSLAGTTERNDLRRKGTKLHDVLARIEMLDKTKTEYKSDYPAIHVAYLLLRQGLDEIHKLPEILKNRGIKQVVISTLDFVPSDELKSQCLRPSTLSEFEELQGMLDGIVSAGAKYGIEIVYYLQSPSERRTWCTENIHHAFFVSASGDVSPCVFTNLPVQAGFCYIKGRKEKYQRTVFGNVNEETADSIWRKKEYRTFRDSMYTINLPAPCVECPKLYVV